MMAGLSFEGYFVDAGTPKSFIEASPLPVILYNVPGRTSVDMQPETVLRLSTHKNIVGIKEASGNKESCLLYTSPSPRD